METAVGSVAEAWELQWSNLAGDWVRTGDLVQVHNYNGRHFGLPGEKGWARCEGDSKKPEVVELDGLTRRVKLLAQLSAGSSALAEIWDASTGAESFTGYTVTVFDWLLPAGGSLAFNAKCVAEFEPRSQRWYVVSPGPTGPLLAKPEVDISQADNSGLVNIYSGVQGAETSTGKQVTAYNRLFGKIRTTQWCWVVSPDGGISWEIIAAEGANNLYGKVKGSGSPSAVDVVNVGGIATIAVWYNSADTGVTVSALVKHAPVIETEFVDCYWNGETYVVGAGDFDGGIMGFAFDGITKGGVSSNVKVALNTIVPTGILLNASVNSPLGDISASKYTWVARNRNGFYAVSAEC